MIFNEITFFCIGLRSFPLEISVVRQHFLDFRIKKSDFLWEKLIQIFKTLNKWCHLDFLGLWKKMDGKHFYRLKKSTLI